MVSAIKNPWFAPSLSFGVINRLLMRLFTPDALGTDTLPDSVKRDLGLLDGRPSRNRTDACWSDLRRHGDWMRSGPM